MNIVILISGYGSNMKAIIEYIKTNKLPINIKAVISNNPNAHGLTTANQLGINTFTVDCSQLDFSDSLLEVVTPLKPDWIILAGFMRIIPAKFISFYQNKILNIHPSLLPKYPGLNTHKKALANKDCKHGCTIHLVNEQLDAGPIIAQSTCIIEETDTEESLKTKVQKLEHKLYPKTIASLLTSNNLAPTY